MNERIRQLEDDCWEELGEDECYYPVFNKEKFAELIVRQCIYEMMHECVTNPESSIPIHDFMTVVAKLIQTRFGVEE